MINNCDTKEVEMHDNTLKGKQYPMEYFAADDSHMNVAVFSKYPILKNQAKLIFIPARTIVMAPIETLFKVVNFFQCSY